MHWNQRTAFEKMTPFLVNWLSIFFKGVNDFSSKSWSSVKIMRKFWPNALAISKKRVIKINFFRILANAKETFLIPIGHTEKKSIILIMRTKCFNVNVLNVTKREILIQVKFFHDDQSVYVYIESFFIHNYFSFIFINSSSIY